MRFTSVLAALALAACASTGKPKDHGEPMTTTSQAPAASTPSSAPPVVSRPRGDEMSPIMPHRGPSRVVFAGDRIALLTDSALVLWKRADASEELKLPLHEPLGLGVLGDGSVAVMHRAADDQRLFCRVAPGAKALTCLKVEAGEPNRLTYVTTDGTPGGVWLKAPHGKLIRYRQGADALEIAGLAGVIDAAYDTLVPLGDGRSIYTEGFNLYVAGADGVKRFEGTTASVDLVAPGSRPDTAWVASDANGLRLVPLADGMKPIVELPPAEKTVPVAMASDGKRVAVLWADVHDKVKASVTLLVYKADGNVEMTLTPPWQPTNAAETDAVSLALSGDRLVMGGVPRFLVWDVPSGKLLTDSKP
jgi:hypothetical protein